MAGRYTLLLGGARSGKSSLAQRMASQQSSAVCVVATAEAIDDDMTARIRRHRAERPTEWSTVEEPLHVAKCVHEHDSEFLIIDCLTVWLGNALHRGWTDDRVLQEVSDLVTALTQRAADAVVVSNEVGLGIHPETPLGRHYRDLLGIVNARVAAAAHTSLFLAAGRVMRLEDPTDVLGWSSGD